MACEAESNPLPPSATSNPLKMLATRNSSSEKSEKCAVEPLACVHHHPRCSCFYKGSSCPGPNPTPGHPDRSIEEGNDEEDVAEAREGQKSNGTPKQTEP